MGMRVQVRIPGWDAYNEKRKDVTKPSWLRLEKNLPRSKSLFGVKAADRYVFVTLLCLACDEQSADLDFDSEWFAYTYGCGAFSEADLLSAVKRLAGKVIEVKDEANTIIMVEPASSDTDAGRERNEPGPQTSLYETRRDETERNETEGEGDRGPRAPDARVEIDERLITLPMGNFLDDVTVGAQRAWIDGYGLDLVRAELPRCRAGWESDPKRRTDYQQAAKGGKPTYVRRWLQNAVKDRDKSARAGPRADFDIAAAIRKRDAAEGVS